MFRNQNRNALKNVANLQFALVLLFVIKFLISFDAFREQNQSVNFYKNNYSKCYPTIGFLT